MKKKRKKKRVLNRQGQPWSQQEEDLLRELYPSMFNFELAERFGRTSDAICTKAGQLRLKKNWRKYDSTTFKKGKLWSKKEINRLKKLYPILPISKLRGHFPKRSDGTITTTALSLGLKKNYIKQPHSPNYNLWRKQKDLLAKLYPTTDNKELAQLLGRTPCAIQAQATKMGLHKSLYVPGKQSGKGERLWTPKEDNLLRKLYPTTKTKDLAAQLDRTVDAVITRAGRLGVRKNDRKRQTNL